MSRTCHNSPRRSLGDWGGVLRSIAFCPQSARPTEVLRDIIVGFPARSIHAQRVSNPPATSPAPQKTRPANAAAGGLCPFFPVFLPASFAPDQIATPAEITGCDSPGQATKLASRNAA